jgi:hypothetical protein
MGHGWHNNRRWRFVAATEPQAVYSFTITVIPTAGHGTI